jgi:hypothetical protein
LSRGGFGDEREDQRTHYATDTTRTTERRRPTQILLIQELYLFLYIRYISGMTLSLGKGEKLLALKNAYPG